MSTLEMISVKSSKDDHYQYNEESVKLNQEVREDPDDFTKSGEVTSNGLITGTHEETQMTHTSLIGCLQEKLGHRAKQVLISSSLVLYAAYFIAAVVLSLHAPCQQENNIMILVYLTLAAIVFCVVFYIKQRIIGCVSEKIFLPVQKYIERHHRIFYWLGLLMIAAVVIIIISLSAISRPESLISIIGWSLLLIILVICSRAPRKIIWRPVIGGFLLQFFMATLVLKWQPGFRLLKELGNLFTNFMKYSEHGAKFVFDIPEQHFFAFTILPVIIFFSTIITILYYFGVMQVVIRSIAMVMRLTVGTTGAESLCAAGNIFMGPTESPIMIRPMLAKMTNSELHAVMVGGFATIAGGVMAAYIKNGVPASHLITASVMNASASLAVSKVMYPELSRSQLTQMKQVFKDKQPYNNLLHAAAAGASAAISLVANVAANLIAFVSLLYLFNDVLSWFGSFVCVPELNFEMISGYILRPLVFTMGVEWKDTGHVAQLLGIKTFLNEFVAYSKLVEMVKSRKECLQGASLSVRSEIIATFALCGFANFGCIGVQLGGLGSMAPGRLVDMTKLAVPAMFGGLITNLMSACLAGLLVSENSEDILLCPNMTLAAVANLTTVST